MWEIVDGTDVLVQQGDVKATAAADYTATVDVTGLKAETRYHYQFMDSHGSTSALGTTKTLTAVGDSANIAVLSCTSLWVRHLRRWLL